VEGGLTVDGRLVDERNQPDFHVKNPPTMSLRCHSLKSPCFPPGDKLERAAPVSDHSSPHQLEIGPDWQLDGVRDMGGCGFIFLMMSQVIQRFP
jgi:hypothetical protein